ncbi:hypothetical protein [Gordonia sp. NPDC003376]
MAGVGKVLTGLGAALMLISVVVGVILAVSGFGKVADQTSQAFAINGSVTRHLDAGAQLTLYAPGTTAGPYPDPLPACAVTGPGVERDSTTQSSSFTFDNTTVRSFAQYRITAAGEYVIDCGNGYAVGAPPLSLSGVFSGVGGVLLAVFGGGLGLLVTIVGVILWVVGRNRRNRERIPPTAPPGNPPPGYPPSGQPPTW